MSHFPVKVDANHHLMMAQRKLKTEGQPSSTRRRRRGSNVRKVMKDGSIRKYLLGSKGDEEEK